MRKGNVFILILAIAMGGVAAFMARNWIASQAGPGAGQRSPARSSWRRCRSAFGTALSRENVTEIPWPSGSMPEGAFATRDELFKDGRRVALTPMQRNELVLKTRSRDPASGPRCRRCWRRASVRSPCASMMCAGWPGFVLPGDRVDVVLIRTVSGGNQAEDFGCAAAARQGARGRPARQRAPGDPHHRQGGDPRSGHRSGAEDSSGDQCRQTLVDPAPGGRKQSCAAQRVTETDLTRPEPVAAAPVAAPARQSNSITVSIIRNMKREEYTVMRSK